MSRSDEIGWVGVGHVRPGESTPCVQMGAYFFQTFLENASSRVV